MEQKINIAEILKNCPKGMELDCTMYENLYLDKIEEEFRYPIECYTIYDGCKTSVNFTEFGEFNSHGTAKCVIFPKGKTTWEGFEPPCKFKSGDVLVSKGGNIVLLSHIDSKNIVHYHCIIPILGSFRIEENTSIGVGKYYECVLANKQQKQRMYDKIKSSGHKYNQSTNKLEKLIEPKFKVGDKIKSVMPSSYYTVVDIKNNQYFIKSDTEKYPYQVPFSYEKNYELVPNKFDITTLKPFDRVLARCSTLEKWRIQLFEKYDKTYQHPFICMGCNKYNQCIPYEENKHLAGTTNDCDEYYKT